MHADAPPAEEHEEPSSDSKVEEEKKSAEPEPKEAEPAEEEGEAAEAEEEEPEDTLPAITEGIYIHLICAIGPEKSTKANRYH